MRVWLRERLGRGGGGEVYRARLGPAWRAWLTRGAWVAAKRLDPERELSERQRARLLREAEVIGGLEHGNLVKLHGMAIDGDGHECVVMELVDGVHLRRVMGAGPVSMAVALYIVRSILSGLHCAHQAGVVHRDVSPRNVLVGWDGAVKLIDFGLARNEGEAPTTGAGLRGKLPYMSPEQARGDEVDRRADLFAVGCIAYELLTGRPAFRGSKTEILSRLLVGRTPARPRDVCPSVAPDLDTWVMTLMAMDAAERFQTAKAALDAVDAGTALAALPDDASRGELATRMVTDRDAGVFAAPGQVRTGTRPRRRRWAVGAAIVAVVFAAGIAVVFDGEEASQQGADAPADHVDRDRPAPLELEDRQGPREVLEADTAAVSVPASRDDQEPNTETTLAAPTTNQRSVKKRRSDTSTAPTTAHHDALETAPATSQTQHTPTPREPLGSAQHFPPQSRGTAHRIEPPALGSARAVENGDSR